LGRLLGFFRKAFLMVSKYNQQPWLISYRSRKPQVWKEAIDWRH
jgi:hypothetical protein